jgi:PIN domain nuclease of toxin-antitoxin system
LYWIPAQPAAVRRQLEEPKNELFLSPVSIWEARHLVRRKRLRIKQSFSAWLELVFTRVPLNEAPFNFAVAAEASGIDLPEADPGDVFLAATAAGFPPATNRASPSGGAAMPSTEMSRRLRA